MQGDAVYACQVCRAEYDLETAVQLAFTCHGKPLARQPSGLVEVSVEQARAAAQDVTALLSHVQPAPLFARGGGQRVVEVIPPLNNEHDAQVVEALLASVAAGDTFSLEIGATSDGRRFLVRGAPATLDHVVNQLRAAYGQVRIEPLQPDNDPAQAITDKMVTSGQAIACGQLRLNRPVFYPLRTYKEFEPGDPITTLLGGFYGLGPGEVALSQLVLSPAPDAWADRMQKSSVEPRAQQMTLTGQMIPAAFAGGIVTFVIAAVLTLAYRGQWLCQGAIWVGVAVVWWALVQVAMKANEWMSIDPGVTRRKTSQAAYLADVRLWAMSGTDEGARQLLARMAAAYRLFNLAEGNRLELRLGVDPPPKAKFRTPLELGLSEGARATILNVTELAGMWHLPLGENPAQVKSDLYSKFLPVPSTVNGPGSVPVGRSIKDGQAVPVSLSAQAARRNIVVIGKTQKGKTTLMGHLATDVMARARHALVVIAPHRDLVDWLCTLVPEERVEDVILVDLSNAERVVGLNLLDAHFGVEPDKLVNDIMAMGQEIWTDNWGPRMEAAFVNAAKTLSLANKRLPADEQFTLLEVPYLFSNTAFTDSLLVRFVQDPRIHDWWTRFRAYTPSFQEQCISPVLTKVDKFASTAAACHMIGQSRSTVDLRQAITQGKIVLINTAAGEIGTEISGFLGAVILNHVNAIVREQIALKRQERALVTVVIDEFQSIPGVNYAALLAELLKMGANFVLGTQSLTQLDRVDPQLKGAIFANVDTTVVFQCSGEDARYLYYELDGKVEFTDLTNLDPHRCYVKTVDDQGKRLPVYDIETISPQEGDAPGVAERIREHAVRYTTPAAQVKAIMEARRERWYPGEVRDKGAQKAVQAVAAGEPDPGALAKLGAVMNSDSAGRDDNAQRPQKPSADGGQQSAVSDQQAEDEE